MESHDARLTEEISQLSRQAGKGEPIGSLQRVKFESIQPMPEGVLDKIRESVTREALSTFEVNLGNLIGFIQTNGREPNRGEEFEGRFPEQWRNKQRTAYNAGLLPTIRIQAIESAFERDLGVGYWSWDPQLQHDLEMVSHLREFIDDSLADRYTPFVRINRGAGKSICKHGKDVGKWVGSKKQIQKMFQLDPKLKKALAEVEGFTLDDSNKAVFEWAVNHYAEYVEEHGYPPSEDYVTGTFGTRAKEGFRLGNVIGGWRGTYRRKQMPAWKVKRLNEVGFAWSVPRGNFRKTSTVSDDQWLAKLEELKTYMFENSGNFPPYSKTDPESRKSVTVKEGVWLSNQRGRFTDLTNERQTELRKLPGWIDP